MNDGDDTVPRGASAALRSSATEPGRQQSAGRGRGPCRRAGGLGRRRRLGHIHPAPDLATPRPRGGWAARGRAGRPLSHHHGAWAGAAPPRGLAVGLRAAGTLHRDGTATGTPGVRPIGARYPGRPGAAPPAVHGHGFAGDGRGVSWARSSPRPISRTRRLGHRRPGSSPRYRSSAESHCSTP